MLFGIDQITSVWDFTVDNACFELVCTVCGLCSAELWSCMRPAEVTWMLRARDSMAQRQPRSDPRWFTSGSQHSFVLRPGVGRIIDH